jgi:hypothetical protein
MSSSHRRRLARLKAQQPKPQEDNRFEPWGADDARAAWSSVGAQERERFWEAFQKAGPCGNHAPCMVRLQENGLWALSRFNTHLGGVEYHFTRVCQALGAEAMLTWLEAEATQGEIEALTRMFESSWEPMALEAGDLDALRNLCLRLPKTR